MRTILVGTLLLAAGACGDSTTPTPLTGNARLQVVNTLTNVGSVDVLVGGKLAIAALPAGQASLVTAVPEGMQDVAVRATGSSATPHAVSLNLVAGDTTTVLTIDSSTILNPWVLTDTGSVVPAGRTKLRVVNFVDSATSILAWRTQPDWSDFITVQFPFPAWNASPYLESDPGDWRVLIATAAYQGGVPALTDTLAMTEAITIPAGQSRTVIAMDDGSGGVTLVVITP